MEALLIINSILVAICLLFIINFHKEFRAIRKRVDLLEQELKIISLLTEKHKSS